METEADQFSNGIFIPCFASREERFRTKAAPVLHRPPVIPYFVPWVYALSRAHCITTHFCTAYTRHFT